MKFNKLVEGQSYQITNSPLLDNNIYKKQYGLLYKKQEKETHWTLSNLDFKQVAECNFVAVVEYHTFEEAVAWMKNGGKAEINHYPGCHNDTYTMSLNGSGLISMKWAESDDDEASFTLDMLEPKWILLDKED